MFSRTWLAEVFEAFSSKTTWNIC